MKKLIYLFVLIIVLITSCLPEKDKLPQSHPVDSDLSATSDKNDTMRIDFNTINTEIEDIEILFDLEEKEDSKEEREDVVLSPSSSEIDSNQFTLEEATSQVVPKYKWRISTEDFEDLNLESIDSFTELLDLYTTINLDEINSVILSNLQIDSFDGLERLPNVQSLHLNSCEINDFYGIYFNSSEQYNLMMINKPYIWLSGSTIKSLNGIDGIENLTSLIIMNSTLIDTSSIHFPSQLRLLSLTNTSQFREYLSLLPKDLEVLSLSQTDANENDISILREHGNIKSIYLKDTPLMDEEAEAELVQIKKDMEPIVLKDMYIDIQ